MYLMFLHQNDNFALFGKFYIKSGMHINFYCIEVLHGSSKRAAST